MYKHIDNIFLAIVALLALVLGFWGFSICGDACGAVTWAQRLIDTLNLVRGAYRFTPGNQPWQLVVAQFAVPGVALLTAARLFLAGMRRDFRVALARRKLNHTIVCGLGDAGMQIAQNLCDAGQEVVAIDLANDSLNALACEQNGVPVLKGDARNPQILKAAGIRRSRAVIVCTGNDAENMDVALRMEEFVSRHSYNQSSKFLILVEQRNDWLYSKLLNHDKKPLGSANVDFRLFNPYANAARILVRSLRLPPSPEFAAPTFVVVGFGSMGRAATLHLIRAAPVGLEQTPRFLIIDRDAEQLRQRFIMGNPAAAEIADLQFVSATLDSSLPDMKRIVAEKLRAAGPLAAVVVCLGDDETSLGSALELRALLDRIGQIRVPVYLRLAQYGHLGRFTSEIESLAQVKDRLHVFGTLEEIFSLDVLLDSKLDVLAQALHVDYRQRSKEHINPQADVPWHELPEFMKMSNRWRADHTLLMAALAGFSVREEVGSPEALSLTGDEIEMLAQLEHRRFTIERRLLDWQQGEKRRHAQRQGPHLAGWSMLAESQREWNRKEVAKLPEVLAGLGVELRRERTIRAYGPGLAKAAAEVERAAASPQAMRYILIADLDDPEACKIAERALNLPAVGIWLFSREEPQEFFERKPRNALKGLHAVIERAEGWVPREQVAMQETVPQVL